MKMKECAWCGGTKKATEFKESNKSRDGLSSYCLECMAKPLPKSVERIKASENITQKKKCVRCRRKKLISEFGNDKNKKDGKNKYCRMCCSHNKKKRKNIDRRHKQLLNGRKWCTPCRRYKPLSEFGMDRGKPNWCCKKCASRKESERIKNLSPEEKKRLGKIRYKRLVDKYARLGTTPGKVGYNRNPELSKRKAREWQIKNKKKRQNYMREYARKNPDRFATARNIRRARKKASGGLYTLEQWEKLISFYAPRGRCIVCGLKRKLVADHVVPLINHGTNWIENIQPLCQKCNLKKKVRDTDYRSDHGKFARSLMGKV